MSKERLQIKAFHMKNVVLGKKVKIENNELIIPTEIEYDKNIFESVEVKIIKQNQIEIAKDKNIIEKLVAIATKIDPKHRKGFSPSSLTTYVRNPIDFYQQQILDIRDEAEVEEIVEDRSLGTIIHRILELLYTPYVNSIISKKNIDEIRKKVRETTEIVFKEYQQNDEISGKNIFVQQTIEEYVMKFLAIDEKKCERSIYLFLDRGYYTRMLPPKCYDRVDAHKRRRQASKYSTK